jgi:hypothetical protein
MSAPGGPGDDAHAPQGGRDDWTPPWDPPALDYPAYPPGYPTGYPPGYPAAYPGEYPPPIPPMPPPGYGPPPGYVPPPGYGPPSYPGGYYATPDYRVQTGTNGLAIASLIASFSGFLCCAVGSIVAIVLGAIALNQIKQTRQEGYGLAVTGIVIGVGTLAVFFIVAMLSIRLH